MSFGRLPAARGHQPIGEINIAPLVDVVLVLLVVFIVAAPLMASRLALDLPSAESAAPAPAALRTVSLALDESGRLRWNGELVPDGALAARLQTQASLEPATELQLQAGAEVPYGRVVQLIGAAQAAGLSRIGFVAQGTAPAR